MGARLFPDDILFVQRLLRAERLYLHRLDGIWGPRTEAAAVAFEERSEEIRAAAGTFDSRSERNISTLSLKGQRLARLFLARVLDGGLIARIISGTRTYADQNALFRKGRFGNPGPIVTRARGGFSNHNFCIGWDIGIFTPEGGYLPDGPEYDRAAALGASPEIEWGGTWTTFPDRSHYQVRLGISASELRQLFERGDPIPLFT